MRTSIFIKTIFIFLLLSGVLGERVPLKEPFPSSAFAKYGLVDIQQNNLANQVFIPLIATADAKPGYDTYEPNDFGEPYGPLVPGRTYISYISSDNDEDWYFIDSSDWDVGGNLRIELWNINSPATDLDMELYSAPNRCPSIVSDLEGPTEKIQTIQSRHLPYKLRVYRWSGSQNSPTQPYYLKISYDVERDQGDIWGVIDEKKFGYRYGFFVSLNHYDVQNRLIDRYYAMVDSSGDYHFRGIPDLIPGQSYEPYFQNRQRNNCYVLDNSIGYAGRPRITAYQSGSSLFVGNMDLNEIKLGGPNDYDWVQSYPVNFLWTPRSSSPDESYVLYIHNSFYNQFWSSAYLGHASSFYMSGLPSGLTPNRAYAWGILAYQADGGFAGSYHENNVAFSNSGAFKSESLYPIMPMRVPYK